MKAFIQALAIVVVLSGFVSSGVAKADDTRQNMLNIVRVISPGGIEAWLVVDKQNPIINMRFAFRGGASLDPKGKEGLANLVSSLLDEGAGELDSQSFQRRLDALSVVLRFDAGRDTFSGRLKTLTDNRDQAFELLKLSLSVPRFDAAPVERMRSQILAGLRHDLEDPGTIASRALSKTLFPNHPYGRPVDGTPQSVKGITTDDLSTFVSQRLARDNLMIGVVGDITPEELARRLDEVFASLPEKSMAEVVLEASPIISGSIEVIPMKVPQSAIVFAQKGPKRHEPDFYPAYVLNHILGGGGFTSRLYDEIREKRGLAYSVGSYLYPLKYAGLIQGYGGTANSRVGETLDVLKSEWRRMAENGVDQNTLDDAKTYLIGSYPLRFTSSGAIASILVSMQAENLGIDYLDKRNALVEAVTRDDVNTLARRLLKADDLVFVVVGAPNGVKSNH